MHGVPETGPPLLLWAGSEDCRIVKRWRRVVSRVRSFMPPCSEVLCRAATPGNIIDVHGEFQTAQCSSCSRLVHQSVSRQDTDPEGQTAPS